MRDTGPDLPADHEIELGDGRKLAYVELGDPSGFPLLSNHGGLSSRLDIVPADAAAKAHGLRIISPDRPGIGRSDPSPGRTMAGWADDVGQLLDGLGIERAAVIGWSFGGCFAQAVAHFAADRTAMLVLVASGIPRDWRGMREDIDRMDRVFLKLSEGPVGRTVERSVFHLMHATAHLAPKAFARGSGFPEGAAAALTTAIESGLSDTAGVVEDYQVLNRPWGFDPSQIAVPTQIWQGDADELVPPDWGPRLHEAITGSSYTAVAGATHFLWYDHWDDIFDGIKATIA